MLNEERCIELEDAVIERIKKLYPKKDGVEGLIPVIAQIAAQTTIITLQEYEKMNQQ